jgi:hypothetical protein
MSSAVEGGEDDHRGRVLARAQLLGRREAVHAGIRMSISTRSGL